MIGWLSNWMILFLVFQSLTWTFEPQHFHVWIRNPRSDVRPTLRLAHVGVSVSLGNEIIMHQYSLLPNFYRMVGFLVAFSLMCFSTSDKIVVVVVSITWFMLCSLLLWWISVLYEGRSFFESYQSLYRRFKYSIKEWSRCRFTGRRPRDTNVHLNVPGSGLTSSRQLPWNWQVLLMLVLIYLF